MLQGFLSGAYQSGSCWWQRVPSTAIVGQPLRLGARISIRTWENIESGCPPAPSVPKDSMGRTGIRLWLCDKITCSLAACHDPEIWRWSPDFIVDFGSNQGGVVEGYGALMLCVKPEKRRSATVQGRELSPSVSWGW